MSINKILGEIYLEAREEVERGQVADYIPELKKASLDDLALVVMTLDGEVYSFGDSGKDFSLQSISKILALGLALEDRGLEEVMTRVSFKATEAAFNSFAGLEVEGSLPANPMINAGAIATTSLIKGERLARLLELIGGLVGRKIDYSRSIYRSESETGDRNKALAYILKNKGILGQDFDQVLDDYFKQCSIEVNALDLARLGYVFANAGRDLSGRRVFSRETVRIVNGSMATAGMYDYSGEYAIRVGIPSKSGVSGAILAVLPNRAAIAVYSPGLDGYGNSVLGQRMLERISKELEYSIF